MRSAALCLWHGSCMGCGHGAWVWALLPTPPVGAVTLTGPNVACAMSFDCGLHPIDMTATESVNGYKNTYDDASTSYLHVLDISISITRRKLVAATSGHWPATA